MEENGDNGYEKRWPGEFDGYRRTTPHVSFISTRNTRVKFMLQIDSTPVPYCVHLIQYSQYLFSFILSLVLLFFGSPKHPGHTPLTIGRLMSYIYIWSTHS